jgi:hypothetical protein
MRIRVIQKPTADEVDGIRLDTFEPGIQYEVGNQLGALMLAEQWAEPVASDEPAVVIPISEFIADTPAKGPKNLVREFFPGYFDSSTLTAADRRRDRRRGDKR